MADEQSGDRSSLEKTFFLRRWGLFLVVIGFLALLHGLFGMNFLVTLLAIVLMSITFPRTERTPHWARALLGIVGYFVLITSVYFGLIWLSKTFDLNAEMTLSAGFLAIGIFLLIRVELLWQPRSSDNNAISRMINKIRSL